jgi:hypothetical protein
MPVVKSASVGRCHVSQFSGTISPTPKSRSLRKNGWSKPVKT